MNAAAAGRTWEDASSPAALRITRRYEDAWQEAWRHGRKLEPAEFLAAQTDAAESPGSLLALLRSDLTLRWDAGDRLGARWYLERYPQIGEDALVALIYEEYCLREEEGERLDPADYLARYPEHAAALRRVLDIHQLIGSGIAEGSSTVPASSTLSPVAATPTQVSFPEVDQTIGGFYLVEELGRGAFGRVFLARERQLADRPVALKVTRRGSREPQALARLQHTHIVPVHSHRVDPATGLHLLCMPFFGRITLARLLEEVEAEQADLTGASLVRALDRLGESAEGRSTVNSACRLALSRRTFAQAIAWWGARLAEALGHAHDRGVLHRDIKPSNVLVIDDGMPMLLDFNLAQESVLDDEEPGSDAEGMLGGTVDYMAPEHLEALAEGSSRKVDGRSDIYGLGVLLYEAVVGTKPFPPPRKGQSLADALLRAADDRRQVPDGFFPGEASVPAPLEAVIRRCLEPEPHRRYQLAAELVADLQAVADDQPLVHAREPLMSRVRRRVRRSRRTLALAAVVLLAGIGLLGAYANYQFDRYERFSEVDSLYQKGLAAMDRGDYQAARICFDNATQSVGPSELELVRKLLRWNSFWGFGDKLRRKVEMLWTTPGLDELQDLIQRKATMCDHILSTREKADVLLGRSENLRFRLIGLSEDMPAAVHELKELLQPLGVLTASQEWTKLPHIWPLLDDARRQQLSHEVNELLFLWMAEIEHSLRRVQESPSVRRSDVDSERIKQSLQVCARALGFAEPKGPWLALRARLESHLTDSSGTSAGQQPTATAAAAPSGRLPGEPVHIGRENSAAACFQWGLLNSSQGRRERAIEWLRRAVAEDWSNYWYQFYLAYLEDQEGMLDDALEHYSAAVARQPDSAWVRFSRARLYRARGRWSSALDDLSRARELMGRRPESVQISLEIGVLYQALGNFPKAAAEYNEILAAAPTSHYARAARLNLANIDAESGRERRAQTAYEQLLQANPSDTSIRLSRALFNLRLGRPAKALADLNLLLQPGDEPRNRDEVLATRAIAHLLLRQGENAVADAAEARGLHPTPSNERLWQRAILAAGRFDQFQVDRPEEITLLPIGGAWLTADLLTAAAALAQPRAGRDAAGHRAALSRAVILSALGRHREAVHVVDAALAASPLSAHAHLVRARILRRAGERGAALREVESALRLRTADPELLELRGVLLTEAGRPREALASLDRAMIWTAHPFAHMQKAAALAALGDPQAAVAEWTRALRRDPELPQAFLGRARCYIRLRVWDRALADLEQAAAWTSADLSLQLGIMQTYARCLPERPEQVSRWLYLVARTAGQAWNLIARTAVPSGLVTRGADRLP